MQSSDRLLDLAELAEKCDIVFTMLAADAALEEVFAAFLSGNPKPGSVFVDCSTVFPDLTQVNKNKPLALEKKPIALQH